MYPRKILLAATYCGTKTKADRQINFFICFAALWKYNTSSNNWGSDSDSWKFSCCLFPIITGCGQEIFASKISFIKYFFRSCTVIITGCRGRNKYFYFVRLLRNNFKKKIGWLNPTVINFFFPFFIPPLPIYICTCKMNDSISFFYCFGLGFYDFGGT